MVAPCTCTVVDLAGRPACPRRFPERRGCCRCPVLGVGCRIRGTSKDWPPTWPFSPGRSVGLWEQTPRRAPSTGTAPSPAGLRTDEASQPQKRVRIGSQNRHEYPWRQRLEPTQSVSIEREVQRWKTHHPIRCQERTDCRPLLQQSCSDIRFSDSPESPHASPNLPLLRRPIRCPGVMRKPLHGYPGPRCLFRPLRPPTSDTRFVLLTTL